ncbi:hypothetical protein ATCC90586_010446 [Pythium insidiosum]|nr:hypothetical protein ATCC90586_010446 [Pythium insidiosum]
MMPPKTTRDSPHEQVPVKRGERLLKSKKSVSTPASKEDFIEFQKGFRDFLDADRLERAATKTANGMWPENEVNDLERRRILSHPREISWLLSLFESERLTPSVREYDALMSDTDAVHPTVEEVLSLYDKKPWEVLVKPPEPVAFDKSEPRFAKLYQNAVNRLYKRFAQVLWERTHFFMPADTTVDPKTGKAVGKSRADFLARRRDRGSP